MFPRLAYGMFNTTMGEILIENGSTLGTYSYGYIVGLLSSFPS
jgi:hypothetical protein